MHLDKVKTVKPITVEVGGKVREIKFDLNAYSLLEEKYDSLAEAFAALQKGKLKDVTRILWAGIAHEEMEFDEDGEPIKCKITAYQVGAMVKDVSELVAISEKLGAALSASSPDPATPVPTLTVIDAEPAVGTTGATVVLTEEEQKEKNG